MNILTKHIFKKFWAYFTASIFIMGLFVFIINFFETVNIFSKKNKTMADTFLASFYNTPYYLYLIMPLITLISSVMVFNYLTIHNEYKAIYASGYKKTFILKPIIVSSIFVVILTFIYGDFVAIPLYRKAKKSTVVEIQNSSMAINNIRLIANNVINKKNLKDIYIEDKNENLSLKAEKMLWKDEDKSWVVENVMIISSNSINGFNYVNISTALQYRIDFLPSPDDIFIEKIKDENIMGIIDYVKRIRKLLKLSLNSVNELVALYFKISMILLNIFSVLIAFIIAQTNLIKIKATSISISIIISILLWFMLIVFKRMGNLQIIEPHMVMLMPLLIYCFISAYIMIYKKIL